MFSQTVTVKERQLLPDWAGAIVLAVLAIVVIVVIVRANQKHAG